MKPNESLPVGRARQKLVALRPDLSRRHHAASRLGAGFQRAAGSQSTGIGLSLTSRGIQIRVISCVTEAGQDGPVLAAKVVQSRSWSIGVNTAKKRGTTACCGVENRLLAANAAIPHPFYFSGTPRYCGLKYLSKSRDIQHIGTFETPKNL